ncbi:hypothetical protein TNCV_1004471 [Trichonephila clavipes]|nr:hypothetical protein TNCV_1004471 [Trichonephila clavipes]
MSSTEKNVLGTVRRNPSTSVRAVVGGPRSRVHCVSQHGGKPLHSYHLQRVLSRDCGANWKIRFPQSFRFFLSNHPLSSRFPSPFSENDPFILQGRVHYTPLVISHWQADKSLHTTLGSLESYSRGPNSGSTGPSRMNRRQKARPNTMSLPTTSPFSP